MVVWRGIPLPWSFAVTYRPDRKPEEGQYIGIARVLFPEVFMHMSDFQKME